jgi:hypothetical protein
MQISGLLNATHLGKTLAYPFVAHILDRESDLTRMIRLTGAAAAVVYLPVIVL